MIKVNHYDGTLTRIVRVSKHATPELAQAAIRRAAKKGKVAAIAEKRTAQDPPTTHH